MIAICQNVSYVETYIICDKIVKIWPILAEVNPPAIVNCPGGNFAC